jgi:hypothetical protein
MEKKIGKKRKKRPTHGHNRLNNGPCIGGCWLLQSNIYRDWVLNRHPPTFIRVHQNLLNFSIALKTTNMGGILKTNGAFTLDVKSV